MTMPKMDDALARNAQVGSSATRWVGFGVGLGALATALIVNAVLGPLVTGVVRYPVSAPVLNETLGLEVATLMLVAPLCVVAALLALRRHPAAPFLSFGPLTYSLYIFTQYVLGPGYTEHRPIVALHLGAFVLSAALLVKAVSLASRRAEPATTPRADRRWSRILLAMAAFVATRYIPAFAGMVTGEPIPGDYRDDVTFYWSMLLMDLGIVVPATIATAVGLRRGSSWARRSQYPIIAWFALLSVAVASMAVTKLVNDDPSAHVSTAVMFAVAAAAFVAIAIVRYRPLFQRRDRTAPARRASRLPRAS